MRSPLLALALMVLGQQPTEVMRLEPTDCPASRPVPERPPDDPRASSFASPHGTWYANEERTLWAWWWGRTGTDGYKVLWVRPIGAQLNVSGRRLDSGSEAPGLTAHIPSGYPYSFQASGLSFPDAGCWE